MKVPSTLLNGTMRFVLPCVKATIRGHLRLRISPRFEPLAETKAAEETKERCCRRARAVLEARGLARGSLTGEAQNVIEKYIVALA